MKTAHTPGEWNGKDGQVYSTETGKTLAIIPYFDKDNKEQEANQTLLASAPEMLRMVYDLKNCIERLTSDDALTQYDKDTEAQWIGEAHELLHKINPEYNN